MDSNEETANMEQDEVDGLNEIPHFCGDIDTEQEATIVEHDGLNEFLKFFCSDSDGAEFCCRDSDMQSNEETKVLENDGIDRISDMPDYVLCKILCFLPIKNAMAAKVLSTRWRSLFPFPWIPPIVIDLDDSSYIRDNRARSRVRGTNPRINFEIFADKLLHEMLINVTCLDVLNLKCNDSHSHEKKLSWVSAALRLNVRELSFQVYLTEPEDLFHLLNGYQGLERLEFQRGSNLKLPNGFTLPNLRTLILSSDLTFCAGSSWSFPNLRTLILSEVRISSSEVCSLISSCLALEVLSFKRCYSYGDSSYSWGNSNFCLSIQNPSLKNLTIEDCIGIWQCPLAIDAPKLQVLLCKGLAARSYNVSNPFDSLLSAHIDVEFSYSGDGAEELIAACLNAVDLYLCSLFMDALHLSRAQLPIFKTLKRLALGYIQLDGWAMLARLLCNSPNLEMLTFKQGFCLHDGGYSSFETSMTNNHPCFELQVKEIEFCVFDEKEDEIKLVEYFMNNGKVIEMVKLHCLPFKYEKTRERLSVLPRQSKLLFRPR